MDECAADSRRGACDNWHLPGVDLADLAERIGDDRALLGHLFRLFAEEAPEAVTELRAALAAAEPMQAVMPAHRLKGMAGGLAMGDLQASAHALEVAARAGDAAGLSAALVVVEAQLGDLLPAIAALPETDGMP
jgi:HPt (histidine-containing phosphotransfer) domain-containing protein